MIRMVRFLCCLLFVSASVAEPFRDDFVVADFELRLAERDAWT